MPAKTYEVNISSKHYENGIWNVDCSYTNGDTTRMGVHQVSLPEDASEDDIVIAIAALYQPK